MTFVVKDFLAKKRGIDMQSTPTKEKLERVNCDVCYKEFISKRDLKKYLEIHKPLEYQKCSEWPKLYKCKDGLNFHFKRRQDISRIENKCDQCGKISVIKYTLELHIRRHSDSRTKYDIHVIYVEKATIKKEISRSIWISSHIMEIQNFKHVAFAINKK